MRDALVFRSLVLDAERDTWGGSKAAQRSTEYLAVTSIGLATSVDYEAHGGSNSQGYADMDFKDIIDAQLNIAKRISDEAQKSLRAQSRSAQAAHSPKPRPEAATPRDPIQVLAEVGELDRLLVGMTCHLVQQLGRAQVLAEPAKNSRTPTGAPHVDEDLATLRQKYVRDLETALSSELACELNRDEASDVDYLGFYRSLCKHWNIPPNFPSNG